MDIEELPMHKDTYFFGYGIDIEKPNEMARQIIKLEKENQKLKEQLEVGEQQYNDLVEEKEELQEQLSNSHQINAQQKEFIEWLEKETTKYEDKLNEYNELVKQKKETDTEYYQAKIDEIKLCVYEKVLKRYKEITRGKYEKDN